MVKKIRFKILPDGSTDLKVEGVSGPSCEAFSKPFEEALGTVQSKEKTSEYYEEASDTAYDTDTEGS